VSFSYVTRILSTVNVKGQFITSRNISSLCHLHVSICVLKFLRKVSLVTVNENSSIVAINLSMHDMC